MLLILPDIQRLMEQERVQFRRYPVSGLDEIMLRRIMPGSFHGGPPTPAAEYEQHRINLTRKLAPHPDRSELVYVTHGDCIRDRHVFKGTFVIIDYTIVFPEQDDIVYIRHAGDDMMRIYRREGGKTLLCAANSGKNYAPLEFRQGCDIEIRGVIIKIIIDPRAKISW